MIYTFKLTTNPAPGDYTQKYVDSNNETQWGLSQKIKKEDVTFGKLESGVELERVGIVQVNIQTHCMYM